MHKSEHEELVEKMVDIRNLFDDSDREAEGHGMEDLACCPIAVACYAENKIKRLMAEMTKQVERSERRKILLDTVHGLSKRDGYKNIEEYLNEFNA